MGRGRAPCCDKSKVKRGPWSPCEDMRLITFIGKHGHGNWRALPKEAGLLRCGKSCRLRWINYLSPDVKRGNFTSEEEHLIIDLHSSIGNKWSKIASYLPGRTDNEIKNVWHTHLKKRLAKKSDHKATVMVSSPSSRQSSTLAKQPHTRDNHHGEVIHVEKPDSMDGRTPPCPSNDVLTSVEGLSGQEGEKIEIPLGLELDFWDMLDSLDIPLEFGAARSSDDDEVVMTSEEKSRDGHEVLECKKWLDYLENEVRMNGYLGILEEEMAGEVHNRELIIDTTEGEEDGIGAFTMDIDPLI